MNICSTKQYIFEFFVGFINTGLLYYLYQQLYSCYICITEYNNEEEQTRIVISTFKVLYVVNIFWIWFTFSQCIAKLLRCDCQ
jgi:hypothetical protein